MTLCDHLEIAVQKDVLDTKNNYYISITAQNAMGTIGVIGTGCGNNKINLSSVLQKGTEPDGTAHIIVITEECSERDIQNAIKELQKDSIKINNLIRVM